MPSGGNFWGEPADGDHPQTRTSMPPTLRTQMPEAAPRQHWQGETSTRSWRPHEKPQSNPMQTSMWTPHETPRHENHGEVLDMGTGARHMWNYQAPIEMASQMPFLFFGGGEMPQTEGLKVDKLPVAGIRFETEQEKEPVVDWKDNLQDAKVSRGPLVSKDEISRGLAKARDVAIKGPPLSREELLGRGRVVFERRVPREEMERCGSIVQGPSEPMRGVLVPPEHVEEQQESSQPPPYMSDVPWDMSDDIRLMVEPPVKDHYLTGGLLPGQQGFESGITFGAPTMEHGNLTMQHHLPFSVGPKKLQVTIVQATGLRHLNFTGDNMYCSFKVLRMDGNSGPPTPHCSYETRTVSKTLDPVWNETHEVDAWHIGDPLEFTILDKGLLASKTEGRAVLPSEYFYPNGFDGDVPIEGLTNAILHVRVILGDPTDVSPCAPRGR
eukprot:TRINITY_DN45972_c0_g1_i1.p1 TRINITY_DN45972_c0_g1~~TRINITY_DN45972_c0_g1_i1.p1  ORF type:complete len:492 (+),score=59.69 TRINITY_DN45972_c0_g1_i1:161-1477(+)